MCHRHRQGAALIVVLFVVMTIAILSVGFLSRSDVELACGENMILRTEMDYLAESGLEHARGLISNPQDVNSEYWMGAVGQQLVAGSDDYYDIEVSRADSNSTYGYIYTVDCNSYRLKNGEKIGCCSIRAQFCIGASIAYWSGENATISERITINGDVYCGGDLVNNGYIDGDVFASGTITGGNITGRIHEAVAEAPVDWPGLKADDFRTDYYIGSTQYSVGIISTEDLNDVTLGPTAENPAGIYYRKGTLTLVGNVTINGFLAIGGKGARLIVTGPENTIVAVKNFPALVIKGHLEISGTSPEIIVSGLIQNDNGVLIKGGTQDALVCITGALFANKRGIKVDEAAFGYMTITADTAKASIQTWPSPGVARRRRPAAGAFYKSIERTFD